MPKTVSVTLRGLSGDFDAAVGAEGVAIQGEILGTTFDEEVPDAKMRVSRCAMTWGAANPSSASLTAVAVPCRFRFDFITIARL